jgi:hypothetical protein
VIEEVVGEMVGSVVDKSIEQSTKLHDAVPPTPDGKPPHPPTAATSGVASEFVVPEAATKKPRRALGLAVGLSNLAAGGSVMVESVKSVWGEGRGAQK